MVHLRKLQHLLASPSRLVVPVDHDHLGEIEIIFVVFNTQLLRHLNLSGNIFIVSNSKTLQIVDTTQQTL